MANKRNWLGILVMVLVFGFFLNGCGEIDGGGYTFEFKVEIGTLYAMNVTQIEFINGANENAPVLQTEIVNLFSGEMSETYKVSGFTEKDGDNKRFFGVKVTFDNGEMKFNYASVADKSKIRALIYSSASMWLYDGDSIMKK